jgi:hypothetical protein
MSKGSRSNQTQHTHLLQVLAVQADLQAVPLQVVRTAAALLLHQQRGAAAAVAAAAAAAAPAAGPARRGLCRCPAHAVGLGTLVSSAQPVAAGQGRAGQGDGLVQQITILCKNMLVLMEPVVTSICLKQLTNAGLVLLNPLAGPNCSSCWPWQAGHAECCCLHALLLALVTSCRDTRCCTVQHVGQVRPRLSPRYVCVPALQQQQ